jgi:hypothetical protein
MAYRKFFRVKTLSAILFIAGCSQLMASALELSDRPENDSTVYFIDLSDLLSLRFYTLAKLNTLEIKGSGKKISMKPHGTGSIGVGFNYKFLGLGLSLGLPSSAEDNEIYGRTRRFDLQASYYGRKLAADGFIQKYSGYYLENPDELAFWNEPYYPHSEDIRVFSVGGTAYYIFNSEKFSYKAAYLRNQVQKKSAGSFLCGIYTFYDEVSSKDGLIPGSMPATARDQVDIKDFEAYSFGASFGYMYTVVIRGNFYLNIGLAPGLGYKEFVLTDRDLDRHHINTSGVLLQVRLAMGYEFRRFYLGAQAVSINRNLNFEESEINIGTGQVRFIIGKRFNIHNR